MDLARATAGKLPFAGYSGEGPLTASELKVSRRVSTIARRAKVDLLLVTTWRFCAIIISRRGRFCHTSDADLPDRSMVQHSTKGDRFAASVAMVNAQRFVYILVSQGDRTRYYTGLTSDVQARLSRPTTRGSLRIPRTVDLGTSR